MSNIEEWRIYNPWFDSAKGKGMFHVKCPGRPGKKNEGLFRFKEGSAVQRNEQGNFACWVCGALAPQDLLLLWKGSV